MSLTQNVGKWISYKVKNDSSSEHPTSKQTDQKQNTIKERNSMSFKVLTQVDKSRRLFQH